MSRIKKSILCQIAPLLGVACIIAVNAEAGNKQSRENVPYIRADVGYSHITRRLNNKFHNTRPRGAFIGSMGLGLTINSKFRTDFTASYRGEYRYASTDYVSGLRESQKISSAAFMLNGYWSPVVWQSVSPYLIGGAGLAINRAGTLGNKQRYILGGREKQFAWQLGAGLLYKANDRISADIMYKYVDLGEARTKDTLYNGATEKFISGGVRGMLTAHEITVGIKFNFI